jgi:hypothetical protein
MKKRGRDVVDREIAALKFAQGMLVGILVVTLMSSAYWYAGAVASRYLLDPGEHANPAGNLIPLLAVPLGALPYGVAIGLLEVIGPWLSHRLRMSERTFATVGIVLMALGGLVLVRTSVIQMVGL